MSDRADEVLADIDATLDGYVEWDGHSDDAARWAADGSHERWPRIWVDFAVSNEQFALRGMNWTLSMITIDALLALQAEAARRAALIDAEVERLQNHPLWPELAGVLEDWQIRQVARVLLIDRGVLDPSSALRGDPNVRPLRAFQPESRPGEAVTVVDETTVLAPEQWQEVVRIGADNRARRPRRGLSAQESPYGPAERRGHR